MAPKPSSKLEQIDVIPMCYHCGVRKLNLINCEVWGVRVCQACAETLHRPHHPGCKKVNEEAEGLKSSHRVKRTSFHLLLTHYTGRPISIECQPGIAVRLEDHWAGTYIYFGATMMLVLEDRGAINHSIIDGLKSLSL